LRLQHTTHRLGNAILGEILPTEIEKITKMSKYFAKSASENDMGPWKGITLYY
jgi:hypothetical protein